MVEEPTLAPVTVNTSRNTSAEWFAMQQAHRLHGQIDTARKLIARSKNPALDQIDPLAADSPYIAELLRLYREDLTLARLLDGSDLLLHAEGPGAPAGMPRLQTVNWLCARAERNIKKLVTALLPEAAHGRPDDLDLRLTGIAAGSLYAGFALVGLSKPANLLPDDDTELLDHLRTAIYALPVVPRFVGESAMSRDIVDELPDPAIRDAAMVAAFELAPTGQRGVHTLAISAPRDTSGRGTAPQSLGQKERVVLRETLRGAPLMRKSQIGNFTGVVRGLDLDTGRITLRRVASDIPVLRGVLRENRHAMKQWLDQTVRVHGQYETDATGRPRIINIQTISAVESTLFDAS